MLAFLHLMYGAVITWLLMRQRHLTILVKTIGAPARSTLPPAPPLVPPEIPPDFCINTNDPPSILEGFFSPLQKMMTVLNKTRTIIELQKETRPDCANGVLPGFIVVALLALVFLLLTIYPFVNALYEQRASQLRNAQSDEYEAQLQQLQQLQQQRGEDQKLTSKRESQMEYMKKLLMSAGQQRDRTIKKIEEYRVRVHKYDKEARLREEELEDSNGKVNALLKVMKTNIEEHFEKEKQLTAEVDEKKSEIADYQLAVLASEKEVESLKKQATAREDQIKSEAESHKDILKKCKDQAETFKTQAIDQKHKNESEVKGYKLHINELKAEVEDLQTQVATRDREIDSSVRHHEDNEKELKAQIENLQTEATTLEKIIESNDKEYQDCINALKVQLENSQTLTTNAKDESKSKAEGHERKLEELQKRLREEQNENRIWQMRVNSERPQSQDVVSRAELEKQKNKSFSERAAAATVADRQQNQATKRIRELSSQLDESRKTRIKEIKERDERIRQLEEDNKTLGEVAQVTKATQDQANRQIAQQQDQIERLQAVCDRLKEQATSLQADFMRLIQTQQTTPQTSSPVQADVTEIHQESPLTAQQVLLDNDMNKDSSARICIPDNEEKSIIDQTSDHTTQTDNAQDTINAQSDNANGNENIDDYKQSELIDAVSGNRSSQIDEPEQSQGQSGADSDLVESETQTEDTQTETCAASDINQHCDPVTTNPGASNQPTTSAHGESTQQDPTIGGPSPSSAYTPSSSVSDSKSPSNSKVKQIQHLPEKQLAHDELGVDLPHLLADASEVPVYSDPKRCPESRLRQWNRKQIVSYNHKRKKQEKKKHLKVHYKLAFMVPDKNQSDAKDEYLFFYPVEVKGQAKADGTGAEACDEAKVDGEEAKANRETKADAREAKAIPYEQFLQS